MPRNSRSGHKPSVHRSAPRTITLPTVAYAQTGTSSSITFDTFLSGCEQTFKGLPWRLKSAKFETVVQSTTATTGLTPALVQISLCDAKDTNVEAIQSCRFMALSTQKTIRHMKMRNPNPWKEDEESSQALIIIDNLTTGAELKTSVIVYLTATFQLGTFRFTQPKSIPIAESVPSHIAWAPAPRVNLTRPPDLCGFSLIDKPPDAE